MNIKKEIFKTAGYIFVFCFFDQAFVSAQFPPDTYWVSPTGTATWTLAKSPTPLSGTAACNLSTANSNVNAGDFVYLRGGTYGTGIAPARSGTNAKRITFKGYNGEVAKISGVYTAIAVGGKSYITIDAINADGNNTFADMRGSEYIWIINSILINSTATTGWPVGVLLYNNAHYNWLANNIIGNSGYMTDSDDKGGVMNVGAWDNPGDTTSHNLIENNHLYHGGHHVVELASSYNIFRNNIFHNENWTPCNRPETGNKCGNRDLIISGDDTGHGAFWNVIEGNRFAFAGGSIDDIGGASGASIRDRHTIVRRNMFFLNDGCGAGLYTDSSGGYDPRDCHFYNNVIYKNPVWAKSAEDYRYGFGFVFDNVAGTNPNPPITGVAFKNNLFYSNMTGDIFFYYTNPAVQSVEGNYYKFAHASNQNGRFDPAMPASNIKSAADPLFLNVNFAETVANIANFDFHLQANSPVIDKGVFLTTTTSAGSGVVIPVTDAGYFMDGYGIVESDSIQLQGQQQTVMILSIDYATNRITVSSTLSWTANQGVSLPYQGSALDIGAYEYIPQAQQTISLSQGWNWISFNVLPADLSLNSVFNSIFSQVEQVKTQTQSVIRSGGNWKGDLVNMNGINSGSMFKVKVNAACTMTATGTAIPPTTSIQLQSGWNWAAYLPTTAMSIATALNSIKGQVLQVKSRTGSATYSGGSWSGTLTQLEPGQGYAIKMNNPGILTYPAGL
jgi:hypothetical protein